MGARGRQRYPFLKNALLLTSIISFSCLFLLYSAVHIITKRYEHSAVNGIVVDIPSALYTSALSNKPNVSFYENTTWLIELGANYSSPRVSCDVQLKESNILSCKKGVVTQFQPIIPCNCTKLVNLNEKEISHVKQSLDKWHFCLSSNIGAMMVPTAMKSQQNFTTLSMCHGKRGISHWHSQL